MLGCAVQTIYLVIGLACVATGIFGALTAKSYVDWQVRTFSISQHGIKWFVLYVRAVGVFSAIMGIVFVWMAVTSY